MRNMKITKMVLGLVKTNCYILMNKKTKEAIIVDPSDLEQKIAGMIEELHAKPVAVFLTHGHFDHIMASNEIAEMYQIPIIAHEAEEATFKDPRINMTRDFTKKNTGYEVKVTRYVKDNEELDYAGFYCRVIFTPGHTPGGCCYYFEDEDVLISGDTLFRESCGRTDFPTSSPRDMNKSLSRLFEELPDETEVFPGHEESTNMAYERKYNIFSIYNAKKKKSIFDRFR